MGIFALAAAGSVYIWKTETRNLTADIQINSAGNSPLATSTAETATSSETQNTTTTPTQKAPPTIQVLNDNLSQGDALFISFQGGTPSTAAFNGKPMHIFEFGGFPHAIFPISPTLKSGNYAISATFGSGESVGETVYVEKYPFPVIPTTPINATTSPEIEARLEAESLDFHSTFNRPEEVALFAQTFVPPLHIPLFITSPFGEVRDFGTYQSRHLGVDLRAPAGTPVYAVNDGTVIKIKDYLEYGSTIIVDHGAGIYSVYLHLSRVDAKEGDRVSRDQRIGLTGATGYVSGPHLHLSLRIGDTSVDPMRFMQTLR